MVRVQMIQKEVVSQFYKEAFGEAVKGGPRVMTALPGIFDDNVWASHCKGHDRVFLLPCFPRGESRD